MERRVKGVREDYKSKVLYPFKPLLREFMGPSIAFIETTGVYGMFYDF
jgi:hypothetical protein